MAERKVWSNVANDWVTPVEKERIKHLDVRQRPSTNILVHHSATDRRAADNASSGSNNPPARYVETRTVFQDHVRDLFHVDDDDWVSHLGNQNPADGVASNSYQQQQQQQQGSANRGGGRPGDVRLLEDPKELLARALHVGQPIDTGEEDTSRLATDGVVRRRFVRQVEVPFEREVKVPVKTTVEVPAVRKQEVKVTRQVEVPSHQWVEEEYTDVEEREVTRPKEVWVKKIVDETVVEKVPVTKRRRVKMPTTEIQEVEETVLMDVPTTEIVEVDAFRIDRVQDSRVVEVDEYHEYVVKPTDEVATSYGEVRDVGRTGRRDRRVAGEIYTITDKRLRDIDEDSQPDIGVAHASEDESSVTSRSSVLPYEPTFTETGYTTYASRQPDFESDNGAGAYGAAEPLSDFGIMSNAGDDLTFTVRHATDESGAMPLPWTPPPTTPSNPAMRSTPVRYAASSTGRRSAASSEASFELSPRIARSNLDSPGRTYRISPAPDTLRATQLRSPSRSPSAGRVSSPRSTHSPSRTTRTPSSRHSPGRSAPFNSTFVSYPHGSPRSTYSGRRAHMQLSPVSQARASRGDGY